MAKTLNQVTVVFKACHRHILPLYYHILIIIKKKNQYMKSQLN